MTDAPVDDWLDRFDLGWRPGLFDEYAGHPPAGADARAAVFELVKIDVERRWQAGDRPTVEEYLARCPHLGPAAEVPVHVVRAEVDARERYGGPVGADDLRARFPAQAEHLLAELATGPPAPAPPTAFAPGSMVGRYRVLSRLGGGAMGVVYLTRDTVLNRTVALKVPKFDAARERVVRARFVREAAAAANLRHPNLAQVYDIACADGVDFLTMAFVDGTSLAARLADGPPPLTTAVEWVRKLAGGLAEAHRLGVVHRDLKPSNIIITPAGEPVVIDYGLALSDSGDARLTHDGSVLGTPAYMAPEQVRGELAEIGPASDVYALGVILYELLTGTLPFTGSVKAVFDQVVTAHPVKPSCRNPAVPGWLDAVCRRAMAKRPADRYPTMTALADALTPPSDSAANETRMTSRADGPSSPTRRRWLRTAVVGGVAAAGGGGLAVWLTTGRNHDPESPPQDADWRPAGGAIRIGGTVTAVATGPAHPTLIAWGTDPHGYGAVDRNGTVTFRHTPDAVKRSAVTAVGVCRSVSKMFALYGGAPRFLTLPGGAEDAAPSRLAEKVDPWQEVTAVAWHPTREVVALLYRRSGRTPPALVRLDTTAKPGGTRGAVGELSDDPTAAAFHPDGTRFAVALASGRVELRDGSSFAPVESFAAPARVDALAVLPTGELILLAAGRVTAVDARGQLRRTYTTTATGGALAVGGDGRFVAWAEGADGRIAPAGGGAAVPLVGHTAAVTCCAFAADGRSLVTGSADGTIRAWDRV